MDQQQIALIWAQGRDQHGRPVIGARGDIPWRVPEDFARFKALTMGCPVVMGRVTWESLPVRPLPGRGNIVVSRNPDWRPGDNMTGVATVLETALLAGSALVERTSAGSPVWVIGGGQVYERAMAFADRIEVTEVDVVVDGDTFAPTIDAQQWAEAEAGEWLTSASGLRYRFRSYRRR